MLQWLLNIYDRFSTRRLWLWGCFTTLLIPRLVLALTLRYNEDIMDFLPLEQADREALQVVQSQQSASRIILIIEGDSLREQAAEVCTQYIPDLQTDSDPTEQLQAIYSLLPYFIPDSVYSCLDSLFTRQAVSRALQKDRNILSIPGSGFLATAIRYDPLGLFPLRDFEAHLKNEKRTYAFYDTPYGSTETQKNAALMDSLEHVSQTVAQQFPGLSLRWIGAPVIAVKNAQRIKLDTLLCISLSLVLIIALLAYAFPRKRDLLLILLSVSFGWLTGMAALRLFTSTVSAMVLGIGSILIGIAVNYPLHLLVHQRYTTSVRQTLQEVLSPLVVGNITTVGAFLALVPLKAEALKHLGIFASAMLIGTIVFCIFILPHLMTVRNVPIREIKIPLNLRWLTLQKTIIALTIALSTYLLVSHFLTEQPPLFNSNPASINYMSEQQRKDITFFDSEMNPQRAIHTHKDRANLWHDYWNAHNPDSLIHLIEQEAVQQGFRPEAFTPFYQTLTSWKPAQTFDFSHLTNTLNRDFGYIGIVCSLIVFFFLWLSFKSLKVAIIAFVPMAVSWVWIFAVMRLFGLQFNIVNIILATFIFGQGDDYTIFIVEGLLYERRTGKAILPQYHQSILLSALLMLISIGSLTFAVHPAMHSLGLITLIGMSVVLLMAVTVPPFLFKFMKI